MNYKKITNNIKDLQKLLFKFGKDDQATSLQPGLNKLYQLQKEENRNEK